MAKLPEIHIDLDEMNQAELVALCQWAGIDASRAFSRDQLITCLEKFWPLDVENPIRDYQNRMSEWLLRYWERVRMQAAKKVCPRCHLCRDLQVLECFNRSKKYIEGPR